MEEGDAEEQGSDDEGVEGQRLTRSRRSNAAGLYMLDHGSQLVPKKVCSSLGVDYQTNCICLLSPVALLYV